MKRLMFGTLSIAFLLFFTFHIVYAFQSAKTSVSRDFAAYYCAGSIVIDPSLHDKDVYNQTIMDQVGTERGLDVKPLLYLYSVPVAYLFSPFSLLSYEHAKLAFLLASVLAYLAANLIILNILLPARKWFTFFAVVPWLWQPFTINQYFLQSNAFLLLFIALGVYLAVKKKDTAAGIFFGITILMKVFPVIILLLIGIKNWRILIAGIVTASLFTVFPAAANWLDILRHTQYPNYTHLALWLKNRGALWLPAYEGIIFALSAALVYRFKRSHYLLIGVFGIASTLLISPVVGEYYYTLLMMCFAYLYSVKEKLPLWLKVASIIPFLIFGFIFGYQTLNIFGLLSLCFIFAYIMYKDGTSVAVIKEKIYEDVPANLNPI